MTMLPVPDHWFLDMDEDTAKEVIQKGYCKIGPHCGCWWNRRLASAQCCAANLGVIGDLAKLVAKTKPTRKLTKK